MIQHRHMVLFLTILLGAAFALEASTCVRSNPTPYFFTRSQSRNKVLQVAGQTGHVYIPDADGNYGMGSITLAYERSFRPNRITSCIFGNIEGTCDDDCNTAAIQIQGSAVTNRSSTAWLADYFYLPVGYSSIINFKPRISNVLIFLDKYIGLDDYLCGLYLRFYGPVVHARWDLNFCETNINPGTATYAQGYFGPAATESATITNPNFFNTTNLQTFGEYAQGNQPVIESLLRGGIVTHPLRYAKIYNRSQKRTGFADLRMELGWNFLLTDCYYLGVNVQAAAPTGNAPYAEWLFNPVIGNGNHWELGGGVIAGYTWIMDEAQERALSINLDANLTHLFRATQQRTFDLRGKENSRYMLAMSMGTTTDLTAGDTLAIPSAQFSGQYMPVANLTTSEVTVSIGIQADIVLWLNYIHCNWSFDLGYNLWATSCEKLRISDCTDCSNPYSLFNQNQRNKWALKGDARVFGFEANPAIEVALSGTQSNATIYSGTNATAEASAAQLAIDPLYRVNLGVDNPELAFDGDGNILYAVPGVVVADNQVFTSLDPIFLSPSDIDLVAHQGLTHKIFGHINYTWADHECWVPYLGGGWSAEFDQCKRSDCPTPVSLSGCPNPCDTATSCLRCAPSLWSVWLKGGISFN